MEVPAEDLNQSIESKEGRRELILGTGGDRLRRGRWVLAADGWRWQMMEVRRSACWAWAAAANPHSRVSNRIERQNVAARIDRTSLGAGLNAWHGMAGTVLWARRVEVGESVPATATPRVLGALQPLLRRIGSSITSVGLQLDEVSGELRTHAAVF